MQNESIIYDVAGIGIGPFNLGLAALAAPIKSLQTVFFDARPEFAWHKGLMMDFSKMQVPFLADLVTGADPTNPYSYLAYLKQTGQLYQFVMLEDTYILRKEYNAYCNWVTAQLTSLRFRHNVISVHWDEVREVYLLEVLHNQRMQVWLSRRLVIGVGSEPFIPDRLPTLSDSFLHASQYLPFKHQLLKQQKITIVGSGQSAAEIFYDLLLEKDSSIRQLNWYTRSGRFHPMETAKMTLEMTSPDYVRYFHSLPSHQKEKTLQGQQYLYKGINHDLLTTIYEAMYRFKPDDLMCSLVPNSELTTVAHGATDGYQLTFFHLERQQEFVISTDAVVLATGYQTCMPSFLIGIKDRLRLDESGRYQADLNYAVDVNGREVFVQNAEMHSHGFNAPDLGMGPYRNAVILNAILGYNHYLIEENIAFQNFDPITAFSQTP